MAVGLFAILFLDFKWLKTPLKGRARSILYNIRYSFSLVLIHLVLRLIRG
jgi:hypothetical protein